MRYINPRFTYLLTYLDGSHECGREGSGDCGMRVVVEESGVLKSSRPARREAAC